MRAWLVLILFSVMAVCFTLDPTPTIAEDTTDMMIERYLYNASSTENKNSDKGDQKKNSNGKHFCPKCTSYSLTFEGLSIHEGKQIQLINCKACGHAWQETWTLTNWFWIKSSLPDNHWTSERWNPE